MPEYDYIVKGLTVSQDATFNLSDMYKYLRSFFDLHNYDFYEKEYFDELKEDGKDVRIKWECERKVDDYVKFHIEMKIKGKGLKEVKLKNDVVVKGKVTVEFEAYLEKDYEGDFGNFYMKFIRALYDKFVIYNRLDTYGTEVKEETYELYNELKAFLKLHRYL